MPEILYRISPVTLEMFENCVDFLTTIGLLEYEKGSLVLALVFFDKP